MEQVETMGGRTATLTRIRFTGGEAKFSEEDIESARELEQKLYGLLKFGTFALAQILREVHRKKYFLIDNDKLVAGSDGEFQTPDTEKTAFEKWAKQQGLAHTYSTLMKLIKVADLYDSYRDSFDSLEEFPTKDRLIFLAQHQDHPELPRLMEASTGTPTDWRATVNEVVKGQAPDEAQEAAEQEVKEIRERIAAHRS